MTTAWPLEQQELNLLVTGGWPSGAFVRIRADGLRQGSLETCTDRRRQPPVIHVLAQL